MSQDVCVSFVIREDGLSFLFFLLFNDRGVFSVPQGLLERFDAFTESLSQLRKLPRAKNNKNDEQYQEQMHGLRKSFEHGSPLVIEYFHYNGCLSCCQGLRDKRKE